MRILKKKEIEDYNVQYIAPMVLKGVHENVGYHACWSEDLEKILAEGIKPNGHVNQEVLVTSMYLDQHKTKNISDDFYRTISVYMYHEMRLEFLRDDLKEGNAMIAVDLTDLDWHIASIELSGFCLCSIEEFDKWIKNDDLKKYCKLYWKNCFSKEEYVQRKGEKADKRWGLDEILYMGVMPPERLKVVDKDNIRDLVKDEWKDKYEEIFEKVKLKL